MAKYITTLKQKILLVAISILMTVFAIEIGLRLAAFSYSLYLKTVDQPTDPRGNLSKFTILCLGESTTAMVHSDPQQDWSYPTILKRSLKEQASVAFNVINDGIPGGTSSQLLARLESNLVKYNPDLVIIMIGTNDNGFTVKYQNKPYAKIVYNLQNLKIYKLFIGGILKYVRFSNSEKKIPESNLDSAQRHFKAGRTQDAILKIEAQMLRYPHDERAYKLMGTIYESILDYDQAEAVYMQGVAFWPGKYDFYELLGRLYTYEDPLYRNKKHLGKGIRLLKRAILNFPEQVEPYLALAEIYIEREPVNGEEVSDNSHIKTLLEKAELLSPDSPRLHLLKGLLNKTIGNYVGAEECFNKGIGSMLERKELDFKDVHLFGTLIKSLFDLYLEKENYQQAAGLIERHLESKNLQRAFRSELYRFLHQIYREMGDIKQANQYAQVADDTQSDEYLPGLRHNYRLMCHRLLEKNISVFAMEHPMRHIKSLKKMLVGIDDVVFISNYENFRERLKQKSYKELFLDMYAGDFGHCSREGNTLIVENLTPCIYKEVEKKLGIKLKAE